VRLKRKRERIITKTLFIFVTGKTIDEGAFLRAIIFIILPIPKNVEFITPKNRIILRFVNPLLIQRRVISERIEIVIADLLTTS